MYFRALSRESENEELWFFIWVGRVGEISLDGMISLFINLMLFLVRERSLAKISPFQNGPSSDL